MACGRKALDVENQARNAECSKSMARKVTSADKNLRRWNNIFAVSCAFAISLDPLFFYVVIIDQDKKCLHMDKKLRIAALVMRSLTDVIFLMDFIYLIFLWFQKRKNKKSETSEENNKKSGTREENKKSGTREENKKSGTNTPENESSSGREETSGNSGWKSWLPIIFSGWKSWLPIIFDVLAIVPLPQLLIVVYPTQRVGFVEHQKVVNVLLLYQYVPRFFRFCLSAEVFNITNGIWAKSLLNLYLYIIASHILGAFWYFFSIQREISCWHKACVNHSIDPRGCVNAFYCNSQSTTARNMILLNEQCPLDTSDGALPLFNFGIFLDCLKNRNTEHKKFAKKFWYSFWWGLRNLSNFGTNLTTSTYVWENMFAALISFLGLLLFTYLIGNVQTYMQMEATKAEERRQKAESVRRWISENKFPDDVQKEIEDSIEKILKKERDADVHNPFLVLPWQVQRSVKRYLFTDTLKNVNKLKDMDEKVLTLICDYLMPMTYGENSFVFRMGDPLDCMMFIIQGTMWTYGSSDNQVGQGVSSMVIERLGKGCFYGEELLDWASDCSKELPVSSRRVKSQTKVEAFVLMAEDLKTVFSKCKTQWDFAQS